MNRNTVSSCGAASTSADSTGIVRSSGLSSNNPEQRPWQVDQAVVLHAPQAPPHRGALGSYPLRRSKRRHLLNPRRSHSALSPLTRSSRANGPLPRALPYRCRRMPPQPRPGAWKQPRAPKQPRVGGVPIRFRLVPGSPRRSTTSSQRAQASWRYVPHKPDTRGANSTRNPLRQQPPKRSAPASHGKGSAPSRFAESSTSSQRPSFAPIAPRQGPRDLHRDRSAPPRRDDRNAGNGIRYETNSESTHGVLPERPSADLRQGAES